MLKVNRQGRATSNFEENYMQQLCLASPAPSLKVENWLRGAPLTNFQPGKVYIVEFWSTSCGPCVRAIPHLIELQSEYKDEGLEVVGIAASEEAPTPDQARTKLDAWLTEKVSNLNYRIGFDSTGEMNKLWMDASSSLGVPTFFIVDRDGHIAFIGHPIDIDAVLPKIFNDTWRGSDEAKATDAERIAADHSARTPDPRDDSTGNGSKGLAGSALSG
ncbi:thiol-disulfide isomerase/thioredoxin [Bradyrhizobium sp. S3.5.5]